MRPLKLRMSAFGTYSGLAEIDFEKLGKNGIYLITGDTGAGKTTVFDAITYALYGEPSGNVRDYKMLRSKYADLSTPTFAELQFEYAGKRYRIKRDPGGYMRASKRGSGTTLQPALAELELINTLECPVAISPETLENKEICRTIDEYESSPEYLFVTGNREVNEKILDIMGINRVQFTQIAMIAQGDFLKLLIASTDEREKIFRKIFRTENYEKLERRISADYYEMKSEHEKIKKSINQYLGEISSTETLDPDSMKPDELIEAVERTINSDRTKLAGFEEKYGSAEKKIIELGKLIDREKERLIIQEKATNVENLLKSEKDKLVSFKSQLVTAQELCSENESLKKDVTIVEKELTEYNEIEKVSLELSKIRNALKIKSTEKSNSESKIKEYKLQLDEAESEYQSLSDAGENAVRYKAEKERTENRISVLKKISSDLLLYMDYTSELSKAQSDYISAEKKRRSAEEKYSLNYRLFLDAQAGILAQNLSDGKPCPVCGSVSHPCPAHVPQDSPSENELETMKESLENLSEISRQKSSKASEISAVSETMKKGIMESLEKEGLCTSDNFDCESIMGTLSDEVSAEEEKLKKTVKSISAENNKLKRQAVLRENIPLIEKNIQNTNETVHQCEISISVHSSRIAELEKQIEGIESKLRFPDIKSATKYCNETLQKVKLNTQRLETAEKNLSECEKSINELSGMSVQLQSHLKEYSPVDIETEQKNYNNLETLRNTLRNSISSLKMTIELNSRQFERVKEKYRELEQNEHKLIWLEQIYNTASGSQKGKDKFGLETHVQTAYFDRIVRLANQKLRIMSGGQYLLKRSETADNKKSHTGLDLNVIDNINDTERSVKTLSGGESFKASLSLALGLSEEIQSSAGGIKLDTMFVDEGFGSLDENSLVQAIKALEGISEENRLIGIISHVSELKEKIEKKIVVTKDRNGASHAEIVI